MVPAWLRLLKPMWILQHRLRRLRAGHFNLGRQLCHLHEAKPDRRVTIDVPNRQRFGGTGFDRA